MAASARIEPIDYGGWPHNLRLSNDTVELVVTLDVGPRIIRFAPHGGPNVLAEISSELGGTAEGVWKMRGGHRLWTAPEDPVRTYDPDNAPVQHQVESGHVCVSTRTEPHSSTPLQRTMKIELQPSGSGVVVTHHLKNLGDKPIELALWALTAMAPGGRAFLPLPDGLPRDPGSGVSKAEPQPKTAADFAPNLTLSLWPYFRWGDPRLAFGRKYLQIQQDRTMPATKIGFRNRAGWAAYGNHDLLFVKHMPHEERATYPDGGVNFECYTDGGILELESLSPLLTLRPGAEASHTERWFLHRLTGALPDQTRKTSQPQIASEDISASEDRIDELIVPHLHRP